MTHVDSLAHNFSAKLKVGVETHKAATLHDLDLDTVIQNDNGRKLFTMYLKEFNNSCDNLLTLYLICCCFQNHQRIEDRQRIKQILEKTYNACFIKNELTHLSSDLKQKLGDSLQRKTYNESIFNAVKSELKMLLETEYFPQFLESNFLKENSALVSSLLNPSTAKSGGLSALKIESNSKSTLLMNEDTKSLGKGSSNFFAMPNIPKQKQVVSLPPPTVSQVTTNSSRMLKQSKSSSSSTSSVASVCSTSKQPHVSSKMLKSTNTRSSKSSLSNEPGKLSKSGHYKSNTSINSLNGVLQSPMPPNPYHVASKAIPVSAQDSERQSVISADDNAQNFKMNRIPKLNRQIKDNLMANKDAKLNMPEFNQEASVQPMKKPTENKSQIPLAESDPQEFFTILSNKLENYLTMKQQSVSMKQSSASFCVQSTSSNKVNRNTSLSEHHPGEPSDMSFRDNIDKLNMPYESDIDAQLDEHLNRVYNSNGAEADKTGAHMNPTSLNNSKMSFVKVSSLSSHRRSGHKTDMSLGHNTGDYLGEESNRAAFHNASMSHSHGDSHISKFSNSFTNATKKDGQHHHFYKLTSTSKEVDIDDTHHHQQQAKANEECVDSANEYSTLSKRGSRQKNMETVKPKLSNHHSHDYDSGVSIRSAASIERVNDWLSSSGYQGGSNEDPKKNNSVKKPAQVSQPVAHKKEITGDSGLLKTTVAYYLPGEDLAYISTFNGDYLTLAQFKQLITKKGHFRYFFKTKSDLLDEECVVYQEATDESAVVPMFNNKVIAKIEKCNNLNNS